MGSLGPGDRVWEGAAGCVGVGLLVAAAARNLRLTQSTNMVAVGPAAAGWSWTRTQALAAGPSTTAWPARSPAVPV